MWAKVDKFRYGSADIECLVTVAERNEEELRVISMLTGVKAARDGL